MVVGGRGEGGGRRWEEEGKGGRASMVRRRQGEAGRIYTRFSIAKKKQRCITLLYILTQCRLGLNLVLTFSG